MPSLSFVSISPNKSKDRHIVWICKCACGDIGEYMATRVRLNRVSRCRKCVSQLTSKSKTTHGMRYTKEYTTWVGIKDRCLNKNSKDFERYGNKGITLFSGWISNFESFFNHIGFSPSKAHSVDRIDNKKGYEPGNVRWATSTQQGRNKNGSVFVTDGASVIHINDAAAILMISRGAAHMRLKRGKLNGYSRVRSLV